MPTPVDRKYVYARAGKDVALYVGLLKAAHDTGILRGIETTILQFPSEANQQTTIVHARVTLGEAHFDGIGDACPANVTRQIAPHVIRMAETRAKSRALRDALGETCVVDETDGEDAESGPDKPQQPATPLQPSRAPHAGASQRQTEDGDAQAITRSQYDALQNLDKRLGLSGSDYTSISFAQASALITQKQSQAAQRPRS